MKYFFRINLNIPTNSNKYQLIVTFIFFHIYIIVYFQQSANMRYRSYLWKEILLISFAIIPIQSRFKRILSMQIRLQDTEVYFTVHSQQCWRDRGGSFLPFDHLTYNDATRQGVACSINIVLLLCRICNLVLVYHNKLMMFLYGAIIRLYLYCSMLLI